MNHFGVAVLCSLMSFGCSKSNEPKAQSEPANKVAIDAAAKQPSTAPPIKPAAPVYSNPHSAYCAGLVDDPEVAELVGTKLVYTGGDVNTVPPKAAQCVFTPDVATPGIGISTLQLNCGGDAAASMKAARRQLAKHRTGRVKAGDEAFMSEKRGVLSTTFRVGSCFGGLFTPKADKAKATALAEFLIGKIAADGGQPK